jgi:hypothetical protein
VGTTLCLPKLIAAGVVVEQEGDREAAGDAPVRSIDEILKVLQPYQRGKMLARQGALAPRIDATTSVGVSVPPRAKQGQEAIPPVSPAACAVRSCQRRQCGGPGRSQDLPGTEAWVGSVGTEAGPTGWGRSPAVGVERIHAHPSRHKTAARSRPPTCDQLVQRRNRAAHRRDRVY